jgi:glycosyltransferase involved in cell wall biosynthesis
MGVEEERVFLRYYGKDLDQLPPTLSTGKLRSEIHVPENSKVVGMVAYMYPPKRYLGHRRGIKGHEDLIDALKICLDEGANVAGVFVGGGTKPGHPYERRVRGYAAERLGERGIFLGNRNDVPELYPEFDVAVHPSHSENQGGAAESLLLQIPTIATDVGGFPDIVHPGITGELVPARDPSRLAEAILSTLDNPERSKKMAMQGAMVMREIGDAKKNAAKVLNTYQEILS